MRKPADEEAFCKDLAESGDTKIRCALCMWNDFTLDVPSCRLRELLLGLNPENRETQFLIKRRGGLRVQEKSVLQNTAAVLYFLWKRFYQRFFYCAAAPGGRPPEALQFGEKRGTVCRWNKVK